SRVAATSCRRRRTARSSRWSRATRRRSRRRPDRGPSDRAASSATRRSGCASRGGQAFELVAPMPPPEGGGEPLTLYGEASAPAAPRGSRFCAEFATTTFAGTPCARLGARAAVGGGLLLGLLLPAAVLLLVLLGRAVALAAVALARAAAVVRRVEPRAFDVDRRRMEHLRGRARAADLAELRIRVRDAVEHLEQVPVRATELVDRHCGSKVADGVPGQRPRGQVRMRWKR